MGKDTGANRKRIRSVAEVKLRVITPLEIGETESEIEIGSEIGSESGSESGFESETESEI